MDWIWFITIVLIILLAERIAEKKFSTLQVHFEYLTANVRNQRDEMEARLNKTFSTLKKQLNSISTLQTQLESSFTSLQINLEQKICDLQERTEIISCTSQPQQETQMPTPQYKLEPTNSVLPSQMEIIVSALENQIENLRSDVQASQNKLEIQTVNLQRKSDDKTSDWQAHLETINSQICTLENKLDDNRSGFEAKIQTITPTSLDQLDKNISTLQNNFEERTSELQKRLNDAETVVAFTARVHTDLRGLRDGFIIRFKKVDTNIKEAYNPDNGVFLCPISGLYHFAVTIGSVPDNTVNTALVVTGMDMMDDLGRHVSFVVYKNSCSRAQVLYLKAGYTVCVKITIGNGVIIDRDLSAFSGHLIRMI